MHLQDRLEVNRSSLGLAWVTWLCSTCFLSSFWDQWARLSMCFSRCWQWCKRKRPVMQVPLLLGRLLFVTFPWLKAYHIAKLKVKHERNILHLYCGKNCKVTWWRMWTQEECFSIALINSIYHSGGAKAVALTSGLPCIDVQVYPARQHLMKGVIGAGMQPPLCPSKPCPCHGAVSFF